MIGSTNVVPRFVKPPTIYQQIQNLVRAGKAQEQYSLGDIIPVSGIDWQVVAFDVATPADASLTHSMTLCSVKCVSRLQFDAEEPSNSNNNRKTYGNNRYAHSAIRQWLNSDKPEGQWWTAQHSADVAPVYLNSNAGFLTRLDPDFLAVIGKTKISVAKNTVTDGGDYDILEDYFYLPSRIELGTGNENYMPEGTNFPYFNSNDRRIKQWGDSDFTYYCRTPYHPTSHAVYYIVTGGTVTNTFASKYHGIVPVCNII